MQTTNPCDTEPSTILIDGQPRALVTKKQAAAYLGSVDLAKRCLLATRMGLKGWLHVVRPGRDLLLSAGSVIECAKRIIAGEMPPTYGEGIKDVE